MTKIFFYREDGILKKMPLHDILLLETSGNYVKFLAKDYSLLLRTTLAMAVKLLPADQFVRINRFQVVAIEHIASLSKDFLKLENIPNIEFGVSKQFYAGLLKHFTIIEAPSGDVEKETEG